MNNTGVITIANGGLPYYKMAAALFDTARMHVPHLATAVVTDNPDYFKGICDHVIPSGNFDKDACLLKLHLDTLTPFDRTLFIDADCFIVRDIMSSVEEFSAHEFALVTEQLMTHGHWYTDIERWKSALNVPFIPKFNGGMIWFKRGPVAAKTFADARAMIDKYDEYGFTKFRGWICDEPLIASAMAMNGIRGYADTGELFACPMDCKGSMSIDVLNGTCAFERDGITYRPSVIHFNAGYCTYFHYKRECAKIVIARRLPNSSHWIVSCIVNGIYNPAYMFVTVLRRIKRRVFDSIPFQWLPLMPLSPYW